MNRAEILQRLLTHRRAIITRLAKTINRASTLEIVGLFYDPTSANFLVLSDWRHDNDLVLLWATNGCMQLVGSRKRVYDQFTVVDVERCLIGALLAYEMPTLRQDNQQIGNCPRNW